MGRAVLVGLGGGGGGGVGGSRQCMSYGGGEQGKVRLLGTC